MPNKQPTIFADHCVHSAVVEVLRMHGWQVETAADAGLAAVSDDIIFKYAVKTKQILLTFDGDFGNILRFDIRKSFGVIVVYVNNLKKDDILTLVKSFFSKKIQLKGKLFIVERDQVRVWPKPKAVNYR